MYSSIKKKMTIGFGILLGLTATLVIVVLYNLADMEVQYNFVIEHDAPVIANARQLSKLVVDMETGQRGFLITGDDQFLEPFDNAVSMFSNLMEEEKHLVSDNPPQQNLLKLIEDSVDEWKQRAAEPEIAVRRRVEEASIDAKQLEQILSRTEGTRLMNKIMSLSHEVEVYFSAREDWEGAFTIERLKKCIAESEAKQRGFLVASNELFLEEYTLLQQEELPKLFANLHNVIAERGYEDQLGKKVDQIELLTNQWHTIAAQREIEARQLLDEHPETLEDVVEILRKQTGKRILDRIRGLFDDFIVEEERLTKKRYASASKAARITQNSTILIAFCSLLCGVLIATALTRGITRPIYQLKQALEIVAKGDLEHNIPITSNDEIGEVMKSFNQMVGDLKRLDHEQEQSKHALQEASEFTENIIGSMIDMLLVISPEGIIVRVNQAVCEQLGYTESELIGRPSAILFTQEEFHKNGKLTKSPLTKVLPLNQNELDQLEETDAVDNFEKSLLLSSGETLPALMSSALMKNEEGAVTGIVCVAQDITKRKEAEERLRLAKQAADYANKSKSDFLANMSHEIRTPMTAILGFAENLLDTGLNESEKLNCVYTIRRNGDYLLTLINDILDLSKVEAGKMTVELLTCQTCTIIAEVISLMQVRADEKGLKLSIEYVGEMPETIKTDPVRLRQILINLIGNAIKFTRTGSIRLITRYQNITGRPLLQFDVVDTGCGITKDQLEKLFRPFMQADNSTTRKFGGTGLGLTISKRFAELLGGDIEVVATEIGAGSTFRVTISPEVANDVEMLSNPIKSTYVTEDDTIAEKVSSRNLEGYKILLAEDGPDNQRLISFVLNKAGADVTVENNGKLAMNTALAAAENGDPFDVILMDMQMPVMGGYEATIQLRRRGYHRPIIALTAHAMDSDRQKCLDAGCDDFATKPIDRAKLLSTINSYVEDYQAKNDSLPSS